MYMLSESFYYSYDGITVLMSLINSTDVYKSGNKRVKIQHEINITVLYIGNTWNDGENFRSKTKMFIEI